MTLTGQNIESTEGICRRRVKVEPPAQGQLLEARQVSVESRLRSLTLPVLLGVFGMGMAACGPKRLNVVHTQEQTLLAVGYSADRSQSIFRADYEAQQYCERQEQGVLFLKQDTVYQGRYDEDVTAAGRTAGRVVGALGSSEVARASRALSSPTDYKTTFEFLCQ